MKSFYAVQGANEFVHSEMYSKLIQAYEKREEERKKLFSAIENNEGVRRKAEWTKKWLDKSNPIAVRIIANAITEGIFFLSAFSWIFWLTTAFPGKVPGLIKSNEWTSRDENLHTEAGISLHNSLPHRADPKIIKEMLTSAYETELFFVRNLFPTRVAGFNVARLEEHIRYMVNHWWALLEEPLQKKQGPLLFNDDGTIPRPTDEAPKIYQFVKINFFEVKGTYEAAKYLDQQTADISADF